MALSLAFGLAACGRSTPGAEPAGPPLVVVLSPTHAPDDLPGLAAALSEAAGQPVELRVLPTQQAVMAMAGTTEADAYLTPLFDYLFCAHEYGAHAVLQATRAGGHTTYTGEIVALRGGPIATLADLEGKAVAFVDRYSTSGFILPELLLDRAGVEVTARFAGSPAAAVAELRAGRAAAAALRVGGVPASDDLVALATTPEIPNEPLWVRPGLAPEARDRLARAFTQVAAGPDGERLLRGVADVEGFAPVDASTYAEVHEHVEQVGKRIADLVPGGWWLHHQNAASPGDLGPY